MNTDPSSNLNNLPDYKAYPVEQARRTVTVGRNANPETGEPARFEGGWIVDGETQDGEEYVVIKLNDDGSTSEKRIPKQALDEFQTHLSRERQAEKEGGDTLAERMQGKVGEVASRSVKPDDVEYVPQSLDERIAAGWAVSRSELLAAYSREAPQEENIDKSPDDELLGTFWAMHNNLVERINHAIETAYYTDPSMQAGQIAQDVESMRQLKGLNPNMVSYLQGVIDVCHEVSESGRDRRSRYYRDARSGLQKIGQMVRAIKKSKD